MPWFLKCRRQRRSRRRARGPAIRPCEPLEQRTLLASHPGFVYDTTDELVAVDPIVQAKMGDLLAFISADYEAGNQVGGYSLPATAPGRDEFVWGNGGEIDGVMVTAVAFPDQTDTLAAALAAIGGSSIVSYADHVSVVLPFAAIDDAAAIESLRFADVVYETQANAAISNQADIAFLADVARGRFGVDGTGIRVGVISDSFDVLGGYAFDVATGALPAGVQVLKEGPRYAQDGNQRGTDEGRAMAQLVHSIAPGAELFFASSTGGVASFADSIAQLAAAGCQIIVDDVTESGVPWFQDGIVAQAVNTVVEDHGVAYFTSAGNFARNSYAADFRPVAASSLGALPAELASLPGLVLHDFDPGPGIDVFQRVAVPDGTSSLTLRFQWDQPWGASQSDVDLFVYAADGVTLLRRLEGSHQLNGNPEIARELKVIPGMEQVQLVIARAGGESPTFVKYITYHTDLQAEYATASSTIVGHANSTTGAAVGASFYFRTPAYRQAPAELAPFSSWGGTPILFAQDGTRLETVELREQPRFVAPTIGNTSFFGQDLDGDGLPNFSGTSAAAPNAAAVAALMWQLDSTLSANQIIATLEATAIDMLDAGYDPATGHGLIQAEAALARVGGGSISGTVFEDLDRNGRQAADEQPLVGATVFLDGNGNGLLDMAPAAGDDRRYVAFSSDEPLAIGIRTQLDNPNVPNQGPLLRPFLGVSTLDITGLPGAITDIGVFFKLRSDQTLDNQQIGPIFVTLVSPAGVRLPLLGTTITGEGTTANGFEPKPSFVLATGRPLDILFSRFETPLDEFFPGASGHSFRTQVDAAAFVGVSPNGIWQLQIESNDFDPARTATLDSWKLFLRSAEPAVQTDAAGQYAFTGLSPAAIAGAAAPTLVLPAGRRLLEPLADYHFELAVGQAVDDANFGVTSVMPISRPALRRSGTLRIQPGIVGPQPVQFSWSDLAGAVLSQAAVERFMVVAVTSGRVEKWAGQQWVDITQPLSSGSPLDMLRTLALRVIRPGDQIRWVPSSTSVTGQTAFQILGWDGVSTSDGLSDIRFESAAS